jgi:hypothetical protein
MLTNDAICDGIRELREDAFGADKYLIRNNI